MIDALQMMHLIKNTLEKMGSKFASHEAMMLIYRTGLVESKYKYLSQKGSDIARGFWQCEPNTAYDIIENYIIYRPQLRNKTMSYNIDSSSIVRALKTDIAAQAIMCRLKYRRDPKAIPSWENIKGQAEYWKRVYNTELGKGTIEHFINANKGYDLNYG